MFSVKSNILSALIVGAAIVFATIIYTNASSKELDRQIEAQERQREDQEAAEKQRQQQLDTCLEDARLEGREWLIGITEAAAKEGISLTNEQLYTVSDMLTDTYEKDKDECYRKYSPE